MRKSKLDTPHIKEQVVKQLAVGKSQKSIAEEVDLTQPQVSRFANREDVRPLVEQQQIRLIKALPDAVKNYIDLVREKIPKGDIKRRELQLKASKDILKSGRLLPTPIQSQTLINLYQDNREFLSPRILQILNNDDLDEGIPEEIDLEHLND